MYVYTPDVFSNMYYIEYITERMSDQGESRTLRILKKLEEEIKCPVCLEVPTSTSIPVCRNGHTTCDQCKR